MSQTTFHPTHSSNAYVTVVLPLAVNNTFTYYVPEEWIKEVQFGKRAEVPFGKNKIYAALIIDLHDIPPEGYKPKPILAVIDPKPILNIPQFKLWQWMAKYYCCTLGEIMTAALPSSFRLASETRITISPFYETYYNELKDKEYIIAEALHHQNELSIQDVQKILNQKTVYPLINKLLEKKVIYLKEEIKEKYKPKKVGCVKLQEPYLSQPDLLEEAFDLLSRSTRQVEALMAFIQLSRTNKKVKKQDIYSKANVDNSVLKAMEKKGIFELYEVEVSRLGTYEDDLIESPDLSDQQVNALELIKREFEEKDVVLLHGVTGSGKTRVYIEQIQEHIKRGEQTLYLLPEIALTTQIISRLQKIFGDDIAVYHSRLSHGERVELWHAVMNGKPILLGPRSAMFLPFQKLKLIIVDEEHDPSYKQTDPNPRYNARDTATYLAKLHQAKVILGTATPSIESYSNVKFGKYGLVDMPERFGGIDLPEIVLVDKREEAKARKMQAHFTSVLLEEMQQALENGEQVIIFQNRRGYAPTMHCTVCNWHQECIHCDVSLTYHKFTNHLQCHYCGYQTAVPKECPACGSQQISMRGFGTEKIEDDLKIYFPDAKIARMDWDTARGKTALARIINDFEEGRVNILVGTQMVTKGLDFENVSVVGILSADHILQFPDFRSTERAYQLLTQVSGRAGRKNKRGKVILQAYNVAHPVLHEVLKNNFNKFYHREIIERKEFAYPPYQRLIKVTLKHKKPDKLNTAMKAFVKELHPALTQYIIGPAVPYIGRIRNYYLLQLMLKLPRNMKIINNAKRKLMHASDYVATVEGCSQIRVNIDVDPY